MITLVRTDLRHAVIKEPQAPGSAIGLAIVEVSLSRWLNCPAVATGLLALSLSSAFLFSCYKLTLCKSE
jgi:hypothetical protein